MEKSNATGLVPRYTGRFWGEGGGEVRVCSNGIGRREESLGPINWSCVRTEDESRKAGQRGAS